MDTSDDQIGPQVAAQPRLSAEQIEAIRQSLPPCLRDVQLRPVPSEPRYPPSGPYVPPPRSPRPPGGKRWRHWRAKARGRTPEQLAQTTVLPMLNATTEHDDRPTDNERPSK